MKEIVTGSKDNVFLWVAKKISIKKPPVIGKPPEKQRHPPILLPAIPFSPPLP